MRTGGECAAGRHQVVHEEHGLPVHGPPNSKSTGGKNFSVFPAQLLECGPGPPSASQDRADRNPRGPRQSASDLHAWRESPRAGVPRVRGDGDDTARAARQLAKHGKQHPSHRIEQLLPPSEFRSQQIVPRQPVVTDGRCDREPSGEHRRHLERRVQAHPATMTGPQGLGRTQSIPAGEADRGQRGVE